MLRATIHQLRPLLDAYPERFVLLLVCGVLWPLKFKTVDCLGRACLEAFTRTVDLGQLGHLTAAYGLPVLAVLLLFVPFRRGGQIVAALLRGLGGALFGYGFMLLTINGTGLVRMELIYPYVVLTALLGLALFISSRLPASLKVTALLLYALFFTPSAQIIDGDLYAYAFQGQVDRSGSNGYYALLYANGYLFLAKAVVALAAYVVIDLETLGALYVRARQVSYALRPQTRPQAAPPETRVRFQTLPAARHDRPSTSSRVLGTAGIQDQLERAVPTVATLDDDTALPILPCPAALFDPVQYPGDVVTFGGYVFHPLQFRVLQLLPQTRKAEQREQDYWFRRLRQQYYPHRTLTSTQVLLEVYAVLRHYSPDLLSVGRGGRREPAKTNAARKLLIDWLIALHIEETTDYEFINADKGQG